MSDSTGLGTRHLDAFSAIRTAVLAGLARSLRADQRTCECLADVGLVDSETVSCDPREVDTTSAIRQFRARLAEWAKQEPSILGRIGIRPHEAMCCDQDDLTAGETISTQPMTVVFSDLAGFTTFTSERGDVAARHLLVEHYEAVDTIVRSRGGRVVKTIGDGHMLAFDEAAAAVMGSVEMVANPPPELPLRAGAHHGPVVTADTDLFGHVVNVAARIMEITGGGVAMVTTTVRDKAGRLPRLVFEPAHAEGLRGIANPVDVCEVHAR